MEPYTVDIPLSFLSFNPHLIADAADAEERVRRIKIGLPARYQVIETLVRRIERLEDRVTELEHFQRQVLPEIR